MTGEETVAAVPMDADVFIMEKAPSVSATSSVPATPSVPATSSVPPTSSVHAKPVSVGTFVPSGAGAGAWAGTKCGVRGASSGAGASSTAPHKQKTMWSMLQAPAGDFNGEEKALWESMTAKEDYRKKNGELAFELLTSNWNHVACAEVHQSVRRISQAWD